MTDLAPILQGFFTDRLARQKKASPNTVAAYRDTCKLLLAFAQATTRKAPSSLSLADLDATLVGAFLQHLEDDRGSAASSTMRGRPRPVAVGGALRRLQARTPCGEVVTSGRLGGRQSRHTAIGYVECHGGGAARDQGRFTCR